MTSTKSSKVSTSSTVNGGKGRTASRQHRPQSIMRNLTSLLLDRAKFAAQAGLTYLESDGSYRRDTYKTLGYKRTLGYSDYKARYERGGIAETIIETFPLNTWPSGIVITEDPDPRITTAFEERIAELIQRLELWSVLTRADILAGLGRYSVILIGAEGNLETELSTSTSASLADIWYLKPLPENKATIKSYDVNPSSSRFGMPELYELDLSSEDLPDVSKTLLLRNRLVHHSRILHIAEGKLENTIFGKPRLRAIWNRLDDLDKIVGGGSESAWQRMNPGYHINVSDPTADLDESQWEDLEEETEEFTDGQSRFLFTQGVDVKSMSGQAFSFGANASAIYDEISGVTRIPKRILLGSERGELASSQDRNNLNDTVTIRFEKFAEPVIRDFIDRCMKYGITPQVEEYFIERPSEDELTEAEKASVVDSLARANKSQYEAEGIIITSADEIRGNILSLEPWNEVLDSSEDDGSDIIEDEDDSLETRAAASTTDEEADSPDWKAVHAAADRNRNRIVRLYSTHWNQAADGINNSDFENAISRRNEGEAVRIVYEALNLAEVGLKDTGVIVVTRTSESIVTMPGELLAISTAAARATLRSAKNRGSWYHLQQNRVADKGKRSAVDFTATFDASNPRAIEFAEKQSSTLITRVSFQTKQAIRQIISTGISEGLAPRKLLYKVKDYIGLRPDQFRALQNFIAEGKTPAQIKRYKNKLLRDRAILIARTETMRSANEGQKELWRQNVEGGNLPADQKRELFATPDDRVRDPHWDANGQVVGIDEPFDMGDGTTEPGEAPNCRCGQGLVRPE